MLVILKNNPFSCPQAVIVVLEGSYPAEVKEQALCILGNIGDGEKAKDLIMANEDVLRKLVDYLVSKPFSFFLLMNF